MTSSFTSKAVLFVALLCMFGLAGAQNAKPNSPLTCHGVVCALPTSSCQVLEQNSCLHGGGPPRCPAIVNVADGTSCNDGNVCTSGDVCTAGVCGGSPVVCSSATDICTPSTACATPCDSSGCTVDAANGVGNPTLTVPPGALASAIAISMVDQGGDPNNSSVFHVYSFGPTGTTFSTPATVDLPAPALAANQGVVIEVSDDGTNWSAVATTLSAGRATGPIAHFSLCRTRAFVVAAGSGLIIDDMVDYQDLVQVKTTSGLAIPPLGEGGTCYSGDLYGLCLKITNPTASAITSGQLHVVPWQCYTAYRNFPVPYDGTNDATYEGQHCDFTGLLLPCGEAIYDLATLVPGGVPAGGSVWADISFYANATPLAGGSPPYGCMGSSFMGFDVLFQEPSGTQANSIKTGIRSAKDGPCILVPNGTPYYIYTSTTTCIPAGSVLGLNTCTNASGCRVGWDSLVGATTGYNVPSPANYPTLRCVRPGSPPTPIDCKNFQPGDVAYKNWLNDARF